MGLAANAGWVGGYQNSRTMSGRQGGPFRRFICGNGYKHLYIAAMWFKRGRWQLQATGHSPFAYEL